MPARRMVPAAMDEERGADRLLDGPMAPIGMQIANLGRLLPTARAAVSCWAVAQDIMRLLALSRR